MAVYAGTMILPEQAECADSGIVCQKLQSEDFASYRSIYNACFHPMREALGIEPYDFLQDDSYILAIQDHTYVLKANDEIIGAVTIKENEVDDLIVAYPWRGQGYGHRLLRYAVHLIRKQYPVVQLHVAMWNQKAVDLYSSEGFVMVQTERIR